MSLLEISLVMLIVEIKFSVYKQASKQTNKSSKQTDILMRKSSCVSARGTPLATSHVASARFADRGG